MTRHNLDNHISWLLSREVTPSADVQTAFPTPSRLVEGTSNETLLEDGVHEEVIRSQPSPARNRRPPDVVNVVQDFAESAVATSIIPRSQMPESQQDLVEGTMGTLVSASKPARPKLMSRHQLATPTSTTTATAPSSLKQGYATFLRNNNGWPLSAHSLLDLVADSYRYSIQTIK
jgi:bloom syndrome protein